MHINIIYTNYICVYIGTDKRARVKAMLESRIWLRLELQIYDFGHALTGFHAAGTLSEPESDVFPTATTSMCDDLSGVPH